MTIFQALVLGVIQGLAEFLPISSSAHLSLAPFLFGWEDPGLAFDVALHLGTLAAVLWYFRAEWARLLRAAAHIVRTRRVHGDEERRVVLLAVATVPAALGGVLLEQYAETVFRAPAITAAGLTILGVVLWASDRFAPRVRALVGMRWHDALLIGVAQAVALVPGVSRSGSTMSAGRLLGFDRQSAAVFSFLMSMPITAAAAVFKVPDAVREGGLTAPLVVGILASGVSGCFAISVLLRFLSRHGFGVFAVYRVALAAAVLWTLHARG